MTEVEERRIVLRIFFFFFFFFCFQGIQSVFALDPSILEENETTQKKHPPLLSFQIMETTYLPLELQALILKSLQHSDKNSFKSNRLVCQAWDKICLSIYPLHICPFKRENEYNLYFSILKNGGMGEGSNFLALNLDPNALVSLAMKMDPSVIEFQSFDQMSKENFSPKEYDLFSHALSQKKSVKELSWTGSALEIDFRQNDFLEGFRNAFSTWKNLKKASFQSTDLKFFWGEHFFSIQSLQLNSVRLLRQFFFEKLEKLEKLSIQNCFLEIENIGGFSYLTTLRKITFDRNVYGETLLLKNVFGHLAKLTSLRKVHFSDPFMTHRHGDFLELPPSLTSLSVSHIKLNEKETKAFFHLTSLKKLTLYHIDMELTDYLPLFLPSLKNLTQLKLLNLQRPKPFSRISLDLLPASLEKLEVNFGNIIIPDIILTGFTPFQKLRKAHFSGVHIVSQDFEKLFKCTTLEDLTLYHCPFRDHDFERLEGLYKLKTLCIYTHEQISEIQFLSTIGKLTNLTDIFFASLNFKISPECMKFLKTRRSDLEFSVQKN